MLPADIEEDERLGGDDGGKEERILVSVRMRPLNSKEIELNEHSKWEIINTKTIMLKNSPSDRSMLPCAYSFDRVFGPNSNTLQVYEEGAKEVALSVVNGINSSIFAYGQTSSGKTYTMKGITERTIEDIFYYIKKQEEREFVLKFSAMEIYNEAVRDLLSSDSSPLRLLDDPERGTVVEKLTEKTLCDKSHLEELLAICEDQRKICETSFNEMSSRSHQILRLTIESSARHFHAGQNSSSLAATVNFVDLAGSERSSHTSSAGTMLKEGSHINRSLLTLGSVIRKLSKGRKAHVPYRDSKLTRILQNSLGGNARTAIICTMSPARMHAEQSRNTLVFASCAKQVATSARVNVVMSDKALIRHLQRELSRLQGESLYAAKDEKMTKMEKEIMELIWQRDLAQSRLDDLLSSLGDDRQLEEYGRLKLLPQAHDLSEDDISSRHWGESTELSNVSDDESLISESSSISYQTLISSIPKCKIPNYQQSDIRAKIPKGTASKPKCVPQNIYQAPKIAKYLLQNPEDLCKEVECIETKDLANNNDTEQPSFKEGNGFGLALQHQIKVKISDDDPLSWEQSFCFEDLKLNNDTMIDNFGESFLVRPENGTEASDLEVQSIKVQGGLINEELTGTGLEAPSIPAKEMEKGAQLENSEYTEPNQDLQHTISEAQTVKEATKDAGNETLINSAESLPKQSFEFLKHQLEIIKLWDACNVSLIHRTYFFLLFKGEPTDSVYMEVELRQLSYLKKMISEGKMAETVSLSRKRLKQERVKLYKSMQKKLSSEERNNIYTDWGIKLNSKKRTMQLAMLLWANTRDIGRAEESALLVAKLLEPKLVHKEMFGLSLFPQECHHRSLNWK